MEKIKVVYQAYGRKDIVQQVFFSIASLRAQLSPGQAPLLIHIFTDNKASILEFIGEEKNILVTEFSQVQLQTWRGDIQFVHRVKLEILKQAFVDWDGALVYLDGDTVFLGDPLPLFGKINAKTSLMHIYESSLGKPLDPLTKKVAKFVKGKSFKVSGQLTSVGPDTEMWNAGVIGVDYSNKDLFSSMLELTDQLYAAYPKHVMEQLAVSWALKNNTSLLPSDDLILHYWNQKPEYDQAISAFLLQNPSLRSAIKNYHQFVRPPLKGPKLPAHRRILIKAKALIFGQSVSG